MSPSNSTTSIVSAVLMILLLPVITWMALVLIQRGERINSLEGRVIRLEEKVSNFRADFKEMHEDHDHLLKRLSDANRDVYGYPPAVKRKVEKSNE